jgi:hypothetical protein
MWDLYINSYFKSSGRVVPFCSMRNDEKGSFLRTNNLIEKKNAMGMQGYPI